MSKCILPFIRHDFSANSPCCKIENFDYQKDLKKLLDDHLNGIKNDFCSDCWKLEENKVTSKRQESNQNFKKLGIDVKKVQDRNIKSLVIHTGNVCNLKCVMCGPSWSTSWKLKSEFIKEKSLKGYEISNYKPFNTVDVSAIKDVEWGEIKDIEFLGGETLMSKNLWKVLDLVDTDTTISLLTNGTVVLQDWQIKKIQSLKNIHICLSIDGTDKVFEYCRRSANWDLVQTNILEYKKLFGIDKLSYNVTVHNLNIFYIDDILLKLAKIIPSKSFINIVTEPKQLSIFNLNRVIGNIIKKNNPFFFKKHKINFNGNTKSVENFFSYIKLQDEFDEMSLKDYLPEFYELLKLQFPHHWHS